MKIGVDARSALSGNPRGEGKSLLRLYKEISALHPDWKIIFYGLPGAPPSDINNVSVRTFDIPGFRFNLWENLALPIHAKLDKIDVLHCAGSSAPRYIPGIPIVLTVHDVIPLVFDDGLSKQQVSRFNKQILCGLSSAKVVIAVSENTKTDLIRLFDTPDGKIRVIYWGCDSNHTDTIAQGNLLQGPLDNLELPERYVMAFGGGAPRKNTERIISAFATAAKKLTDLHLLLVGVGDSTTKARFRSLAQKLGIGERVEILNFIDDDMLGTIYQHTQCLLYPSLYEGFGLPVLEAMAKGIPVIASNSSSIPEVTGECAILINPENENELADAISAILGNRQLKENLVTCGMERSKLFTWRRTAIETASALIKSIS